MNVKNVIDIKMVYQVFFLTFRKTFNTHFIKELHHIFKTIISKLFSNQKIFYILFALLIKNVTLGILRVCGSSQDGVYLKKKQIFFLNIPLSQSL